MDKSFQPLIDPGTTWTAWLNVCGRSADVSWAQVAHHGERLRATERAAGRMGSATGQPRGSHGGSCEKEVSEQVQADRPRKTPCVGGGAGIMDVDVKRF